MAGDSLSRAEAEEERGRALGRERERLMKMACWLTGLFYDDCWSVGNVSQFVTCSAMIPCTAFAFSLIDATTYDFSFKKRRYYSFGTIPP